MCDKKDVVSKLPVDEFRRLVEMFVSYKGSARKTSITMEMWLKVLNGALAVDVFVEKFCLGAFNEKELIEKLRMHPLHASVYLRCIADGIQLQKESTT